MKKIVYLSGMMDGVSFEDGNNWRLSASKKLRDAGFEVYNPYERKAADPKHEDFTANEIFHNDIYYLDKSDVVLVNLNISEKINNKDIPFFTIGEMFLAHRDRKPIVSYTNCLSHRAGYKAIVTKTCDDLDSSIDYIITNYL